MTKNTIHEKNYHMEDNISIPVEEPIKNSFVWQKMKGIRKK